MKNNSFLLRHVSVVNHDFTMDDAFILVEENKIKAVGYENNIEQELSLEEQQIPVQHQVKPGTRLVPGMIDMHIHGTSNSDTMDATPEALEVIAGALPAEGTTSFLATTLTSNEEAITNSLQNAAAVRKGKQYKGAELLGIHLEGPFFSEEKAGAQPREFLRDADVDLFQKWQEAADGLIRLVSLDPERDRGHRLIRYLRETGVIVSAGHSNAGIEQITEAVHQGVSRVTHLYNGMSGLNHREPGLAAAALLNKHLQAEIIADAIHVHPAMVKLAYEMKGASGLTMITDSIRAKCMKNVSFKLGGQEVIMEGAKPLLPDGTLAGSVLKMNEAMRNLMTFTKCLPEEAVAMTSWNAARELGEDHRKGRIAPRMDADFTLLNDSFEVEKTWCMGTLAYDKE
ncbi:N-acetylglucosamine-6-phosphate deacetylase [Alteribacillus sp. HJP-4]|uniref:N-acetylglucosamine-6-phosphate deacetylase n=1 Tax=Alteribacillus sp. HJP-4 TaxID=2775394 RepID=UPI0035CD27E2